MTIHCKEVQKVLMQMGGTFNGVTVVAVKLPSFCVAQEGGARPERPASWCTCRRPGFSITDFVTLRNHFILIFNVFKL